MHANARRKLRQTGLPGKAGADITLWCRRFCDAPPVGTRARLRAGEKTCLVQAYTNERGHHCLRRIFWPRWPHDWIDPSTRRPVTTATTPACRGFKSVFD